MREATMDTVTETARPTLFSALVTDPLRMVGGLWDRRDLVVQFTQRNIELRHRGSRLGAFWALLNPLSMLALYFLVFGVFFKQKFNVVPDETHYDLSLAMFLGLALFHVFAETLSLAPSVIVANPNFVKKVVFPLEVLPVANVGSSAFHLGVSVCLVLVGSLFGSTIHLSLHVLWLPVLVVPLLLISLGVAWILAATGVFLRDIGQIMAFVSTALLFATAVTMPPEKIPPELHFLRYNPLFQIIDLARRTVLWQQAMPLEKLAYVYVAALAIFAVGATFFALLRKSFAEVI
jgi:lipopolysaccharide transport system permease protein